MPRIPYPSPELISRDFSGGMAPNLNAVIQDTNMMDLLLNLYTDTKNNNRLGNVKQRLGYEIIGSQIVNKPVLGMGTLRSWNGSTNQVFVAIDNAGSTQTDMYRLVAGAWTNIGGFTPFTAGKKVRMTQFIDYVFVMNGTDAVQTSTNGIAWGNTNAVSMPVVSTAVSFLGRMLAAGNAAQPSRLYLSSVATYPTSISWTIGNDNVDINPDDGAGGITALQPNGNNILIFKNRALYTWDLNETTQQNLVIEVGTFSQECVASLKGVTFFFGEKIDGVGIFATLGTYPTEISQTIASFLQAIPPAYYEHVHTWADDDSFYCGIGDVTVNGVDYGNVTLRFNLPTKQWFVYAYADEFTRAVRYITDSGDLTVIAGSNQGKIMTLDSGTSDNGSPIFFKLISRQLEFGARAALKTLKGVSLFSVNGAGATFAVKSGNKDAKEICQIQSHIETVKSDMNVPGYIFHAIVQGSNTEDLFEFAGWEFVLADYDYTPQYP